MEIIEMKPRYLEKAVEELAFHNDKMAFVSGPRQCGKATLGGMLAAKRSPSRYFSWDDIEFRRLWALSPKSIIPSSRKTPLVVLNEIHKDRTWKRTLKGIFDTLRFEERACDLFVTGSARLNVYRRGSDSLLGRYYHFRLAPFSLREISTPVSFGPDDSIDRLFKRSLTPAAENRDSLSALLQFGPFPEPLLRQNVREWRLWQRGRHDMIIREDLRDIGRSSDLGKIEMLAAILPDRVSSPLSINSLRLDIDVSHPTLKRWLGWLKELYFLFELKPWHERVTRSLKKEGKIYLWDFSEIKDPGARFENLVAAHLFKSCNYWTDTGHGNFELFYLRNRDKKEIDFLIVRDGRPWLPVETKLSDQTPSPNWRKFLPVLECRRGLQITQGTAWKLYAEGDSEVLVAGANEALMYFV